MTTAVSTLTTRQLNRATLARQMLLSREPAAALTAIERLVGCRRNSPGLRSWGYGRTCTPFSETNLLEPLRWRRSPSRHNHRRHRAALRTEAGELDGATDPA